MAVRADDVALRNLLFEAFDGASGGGELTNGRTFDPANVIEVEHDKIPFAAVNARRTFEDCDDMAAGSGHPPGLSIMDLPSVKIASILEVGLEAALAPMLAPALGMLAEVLDRQPPIALAAVGGARTGSAA